MSETLIEEFEILLKEGQLIGQSPQGKEFADFDHWLSVFPEFASFFQNWSQRTLNFLDRKNVREIAQELILDNHLAQAFLLVMIWGYSGDARGPARVRLIMDQPNFIQALDSSIKSLKLNQVENAYDDLIVNGPKHLSTSFGTKLLYFFCEKNQQPTPLIFDKRIFDILNDLNFFPMKSPVLTSNQYMAYLRKISELADKYSLSTENIEEYLFIFSGIRSGNYSWKRHMDFHSLEDQQKNGLALLFSEYLATKLSDPSILPNGNGGGQYGGYVVTGTNRGAEWEIHIATHSSVNLIKPEFIRFDWNLILLRGIAQSTKDLISASY